MRADAPHHMVPRISEFYGIVITMYHEETHRRPLFHASYAGAEASIDIGSLEVLAGGLTRRAQRLVTAWARAHQQELVENWQRAREGRALKRIEPLT